MMKEIVMKFNISHWVKMFMNRLTEVKQMQQSMYAKRINSSTRYAIKRKYATTTRRIIFLDYDGTLVGFKTNIELAAPDEELYQLLKQLSSDQANKLVLVSGRAPKFLEKWFGDLDVDIISEHGAWTKTRNNNWVSVPGLSSGWKKDFYPVLESFTDRTPGAFIEEKDFSLVWHYRKVEESLGELRTNELMNTLRYLVEDKGLQLLPGNKVVEIKNVEINKGKAVLNFVQDGSYDFIMAIGDDHTDEDIFKALPQDAVTIKVGSHVSAASFYTGNYIDVRNFLKELTSYNSMAKDQADVELKKYRRVEFHSNPVRCIHQTYMAVSLREITPLASCFFIYIFAEQQKVIRILQKVLKFSYGIINSANTRQCFNIPECANQECGFRFTKIIRMQITVK